MPLSKAAGGSTIGGGHSATAVLVTGPTSFQDGQHNPEVVMVESERLETVTTIAVDDPAPISPLSKGSLLGFLGSIVLGGGGVGGGGDGSMSPVELKDMSASFRGGSGAPAQDGDFDVCREYNYMADDDEDADADEPSLISDHTAAAYAVKEEEKPREALESYLLGKVYDPVKDYSEKRGDEAALFWFTYRCDFPEIAPYGMRSDAGWGCMLRSAQMLLGQALKLHFKSRGWRPPHMFASRRKDPFIRSMLTWFADFPSTGQCYYSLHNMVAAGLKYDKLPGEWYGPGGACHVIKDLVEMHERRQQETMAKNQSMATAGAPPATTISQQNRIFRVHVAHEQGTVYRNVITDLMTRESRAKLAQEAIKKHETNPQSHPLDFEWEAELIESFTGNNAATSTSTSYVEWDTGLLLLIPVRLGLDRFHPDYVRAVAHTFSFPQSVGILGGRVRGARWFYGAVSDGSKVFGLDPHTVQPAPKSRWAKINGKTMSAVDLTDDYLKSVHTTCPEVLELQKMDPSIALGFYCRNQADFDQLCSLVQRWKTGNPHQPEVFGLAESAPTYTSGAASAMMMGGSSSLDEDGGSAASENEDFVML